MAADHCLQLSRTDLFECLWPLFGAADFQPTTWGTQGLAPVSVGQLAIEPISPPYHRFARLPNFSESFDAFGPLRLDCQMMHDDPGKMSKDH